MNDAAIASLPAEVLIQNIFDAFEKSTIKYCVLRNYELLPEIHGNDVDLFALNAQMPMVESVIGRVSRDAGWEVLTKVCRWGYNGFYLFCGGEYLLIDIFTQCRWRGLAYCAPRAIMESRIRYKSFWIANPGIVSATLLFKELLPWGKVKSKNNARTQIRKCALANPVRFISSLQPPFGKHLAEWTWKKVSEGDWEAIEEKISNYRWILFKRSFARPVAQLLIWIHFILGHLVYRFRNPLSIFIVIIGPDGSGKTTIAQDFMAFWTAKFHTHPFYIHGNFSILPRLRVLRKIWANIRRRELAPEPDFTLKHSGANTVPHTLTKSLCYLAYYYWGYVFGYLKIFLARGKGRPVVADRYFYDYFFQRGNMHLPHPLLRFLSLFIPKPDLVIFLDAPAREIYARKNELTIQEIERQQNAIKRILKWLPHPISISATDGIGKTVEKVKEAVMKSISRKSNKTL